MSPKRLKIQLASVVLVALAAGLIPACGGGDSSGGSAAPPAFIVTDVVPASLAGNVPLQPIFYIRFSRALDGPGTVNNTNIKLTTVAPVSDVACNVTYEDCMKEIRFTPNAALAPSTNYRIDITNGIKDSNGNPYGGGFYFITTGAFTDNVRPGAGVATSADTPTTTSLLVTWTASTEVTATYDIFRSTVAGCFDFAAAPYRTEVAATTSKVVDGLDSDTTYYFVVRAHDAEGNVSTNETSVSGKTLTSFLFDVWPIVNNKCRSCHTSGAGSLVMLMTSAPVTYTNWYDVTIVCNDPGNTIPVTAKRVKPGGGAAAVNDSFVYNKVWSKTIPTAPWCGSAMPFTGSALSSTQLQTFYDWIFQGAANN